MTVSVEAAPTLTLNQTRWYAQHLADALYRNRMTPLRANPPGEKPNFRAIGGGQLPFPGLFHTNAPALPKAGVPAMHIKLGKTDYQAALAAMSRAELEGWWKWVTPVWDVHKRIMPRPALFQSRGTWVQRAPIDRYAQDAALRIMRHATTSAIPLVTD